MFCKVEGCDNYCEGRTDQCASHNAILRKSERLAEKQFLKKSTQTGIKKVSDKLAARLKKYVEIKAKWLPGKMCCVFPDQRSIEPHHSAGRSPDAYYDEWAEQQDIPLLLDVRWWKPVSRDGHIKIENNPEWAKENGFSESRLI